MWGRPGSTAPAGPLAAGGSPARAFTANDVERPFTASCASTVYVAAQHGLRALAAEGRSNKLARRRPAIGEAESIVVHGRAALSCVAFDEACASAAGLRVWPGVPALAAGSKTRGGSAARTPGPARQGRLETYRKSSPHRGDMVSVVFVVTGRSGGRSIKSLEVLQGLSQR